MNGLPAPVAQEIGEAVRTRLITKSDLVCSRIVVERAQDRSIVVRIEQHGTEIVRQLDDVEDSVLPEVVSLVVAMLPGSPQPDPQPKDTRNTTLAEQPPPLTPPVPLVLGQSPQQERPAARLVRPSPVPDRFRLGGGYEITTTARNWIQEHRIALAAEYQVTPLLGVVAMTGLPVKPLEQQSKEVAFQARRLPFRAGPSASWQLRGVSFRTMLLAEVALISERIERRDPSFSTRDNKRHVELGCVPRAEIQVPVDRYTTLAAGVGLGIRLIGSRWSAELLDGRHTILDPGILLPEAYIAVRLGVL